ncbi:MAG: response regulator [Dehalococcoidia bacterium]|nr:response regulator [Dehalococcoidia bacterium]
MPDTILVVDDDEAVRVMLTRLLESAGYAAESASKAAEAHVLLQQQQFALLIVDVVMPGESGVDLAAVVRRDHPPVPIILISGYATEEPRSFAESEDGILFVAKPFGADQFLGLVESMVQASDATGSL